jgi:hypothetical protein
LSGTVVIASALLALLLMVLWVRSAWRSDSLAWGTWETVSRGPTHHFRKFHTVFSLRSEPGYLIADFGPSPAPADDVVVRRVAGSSSGPFDWFVFGFERSAWPTGEVWPTAYFSHYLVAAPAALPALLWLWRRYRRRPAPGICGVCGYDLRATPERCPECGATEEVIPSAAPPPAG